MIHSKIIRTRNTNSPIPRPKVKKSKEWQKLRRINRKHPMKQAHSKVVIRKEANLSNQNKVGILPNQGKEKIIWMLISANSIAKNKKNPHHPIIQSTRNPNNQSQDIFTPLKKKLATNKKLNKNMQLIHPQSVAANSRKVRIGLHRFNWVRSNLIILLLL